MQKHRDELYKTIWRAACELRGEVDGWDFKMYVLGFLFYRFLSENLTRHINDKQREAGDSSFDYASLDDSLMEGENIDETIRMIVDDKGFFIRPSELFCNVLAKHKDDSTELNQTLKAAFDNIVASTQGNKSEAVFKGLFNDIDVDSTKNLGDNIIRRNQKLYKVMNTIASFKLEYGSSDGANSIDIFGDAYEYLMRMYASSAGKSGGEFFTPQEVSHLLARLVSYGKDSVNKVYDPACGSGSLLLQFAKVLGGDKVKQGYYGQEINPTSYNLCRINMLLHNIGYEHFNIALGDVLLNPKHWDCEPFDAIVSNPPYSTKWEGKSNPTLINDPRFAPAGVLAPESKADFAFTMHMLSWLSPQGACAIVEFPGVLYRTGAERQIRKYLADNNFIDTIIQLPANLFYGNTIATCIIVLKKNKQDNNVLFIDASELYTKITNKNRLDQEHIESILQAYAKRENTEHFSTLASYEDIVANDYNLSVQGFVAPKDTREHINILELNANIAQIVERQSILRVQIDSIVSELGA